MLAEMAFNPSMLSSAFIKPLKEMPYHNVDEEPRADLLPILEARDRFGQIVGYPGVHAVLRALTGSPPVCS